MVRREKDDELLVVYDEDDVKNGVEACRPTLMGKLLNAKPVNKQALENAFRNIWSQPKGFKVEETERNTFLFHFAEEYEMTKVLNGGPWTFRNRSERVARKICESVGEVVDVGMFEEPSSGALFMKGLIWYDVKKPLRCMVNLGNAKDGIYWVDFRYEKIPKHCYTCGIFGHDEEECVDGKRADSDHGESDDNNLGPWLKARSVGKKITWPGLNKSGEQRRSVDEGRRVGMVRKVVAEDLMEKLARMTMRDEVAAPNENRCEDVRMDEAQNVLVNPKMGVMQEKVEQIKIKGKSDDVATKVVSLTEQCKEGTNSEIKESEKMTSCTNRRGEGVVLKEIQKVEVGEVVVASEAIKENINPLMKPSGGKQWKRLARNSGLIQEQNSLEQQVGKRKTMVDGTWEDGEKEPSRKGVLNKGVRRSIGNGRSTGVWTDPWIPSDEPTIAIRPSHIEIEDEKVSVLLNEDATEWIDGELRARFEEDICTRIKSIPPNPSQGDNRWTWEHEKKLAAFAEALYHAWERRNKKKFPNELIRAEELWPRVERIMDEFQTVMFNDDWNRMEPANFVWEKPEYPYTKLNVDATTCMDGGGSMGGLLRDETGDCVGVYVHSVSFPNDPALLEAISIRKGLKMAQQIGKTHVIVESDAKIVIDMLKTPCNQASTLNALCRDILSFCSSFQVVIFNWVPRMCNLAADFISRKLRQIVEILFGLIRSLCSSLR
ncbi:cysteine desulfurase mitochondrial-like [Senna tora]|uniref:Cysteine desulfurase mitochondrial-like n=1 Tax=Senna tora TaxID=362788 RepID=A0A834WUJ5_9FABA|nr:cysteine desulfurase mitochondrial-like [Senna tora]